MDERNRPEKSKHQSVILSYLKRPAQDRLPYYALVFYLLIIISGILFLLFNLIPSFADAYNRTVGQFFRMLLALLTAWIPFSLSEAILICIPGFLVWAIIQTMHENLETWKQSLLYTGRIVSFLALILSMLILLFSAGFKGTTLAQKLDYETGDTTEAELESTATFLNNRINELVESGQIGFDESNLSYYEGNWHDLNKTLLRAYEKASQKYDFIKTFPSTLKPIASSPLLTYTHIAGAYTFFTGEVNINYNFPDYVRVFSSAHEMAHQRGFAREDEANFIAFLVCLESDDPYVTYCGLLNCYEYVLSALDSESETASETQWLLLNDYTKREMIAYRDFFSKYSGSPVATVVNSVSQVVQNVSGGKNHSYGVVVDLLVAYHNNLEKGVP